MKQSLKYNMVSKKYYVYIITNTNNSVIYIGVTNNLIRRIFEHKNKLSTGFSSKYNLNKLVYYEVHDSPEESIKREKQLKGGSRKKKLDLIMKFNPKFDDLYENITK